MATQSKRHHVLSGLLAVALSSGHGGQAGAQAVGTAGAANQISSGAPPGSAARTIQIGAQIVRNEKINTSPTGSVQVVFIDKTSLSVGPNSNLVIDEFVFSPAAATGKLALSLAKGLLRVVGGQATHTGGATVATPVASVGIRGGIATISYCGAATTACPRPGLQVTNQFGVVTVTTTQGETQTISRPGFTLHVGTDGTAGGPVRAPQQQVTAELGLLTSSAAQTGGAALVPTDVIGQRAGLGSANAPIDPSTSIARQGQTIARAAVQPVVAAGSTFTGLTNRLVQTAVTQPAVQVAAAQVTAGTASTPVAPAAYALTTTVDQANLGQGQVPYLLASFVGQGTWNVSQILGYRAGGLKTSPTAITTSRVLQAGINVNGVGAGQSSGLFVMTGQVSNDTTFGYTESGQFEATNRLTGKSFDQRAGGNVTSGPNTTDPSAGSVQLDDASLPSGSFNVTTSTLNNQNNMRTYTNTTAGGNNGVPSYTYTQTFQRAATPSGLGDDHPDETLQGFVGGTAQTLRFAPITGNGSALAPTFVVTNATGTPGDVSIVLPGASSRMGATFNIVNATASSADSFKNGTFDFGYLQTGDNTLRGTYVDSRNFGAIERANDTTTTAGNTANVQTSLVNGQNAIQTQNADNFHLLMVTSDTVLGTSSTVHTSSLFPGVNFCACDYTRWGFWSYESYQQNNSANYGDQTTGNLLLWVAGLPAGASDVPTVGTASYTGHVIASINNNGSQYISAANLTSGVNFATGSGTVGVTNLDGTNYAGTLSINASNRAGFAANLPGTPVSTGPLGRSLSLTGAFFNSASSKVGEIGGSAILRGTNYLGGGIFLAHGAPTP